jgi:hypothetical protein
MSLYLDVNEDNGSIIYRFPHRSPEDMPAEASCALDIADQGGASLEDVGRATNVVKERSRQIEEKSLIRLRRRPGKLVDYDETLGAGEPVAVRAKSEGSVFAPRDDAAEPVDEEADDEPAASPVSFFAEPSERADRLVCASVWNMFVKDSRARGFSVSDTDAAYTKRVALERSPMPPASPPERVDLTDRERQILEAYRAHQAKHNAPPTRLELARAVGMKASSDGALMTAIWNASKRLVERGLLPSGKASRAARAKTSRPAKTQVTGASSPKTNGAPSNGHVTNGVHRPPSSRGNGNGAAVRTRDTSGDPVLTALIAKRDELADKVAALSVAIEAMS